MATRQAYDAPKQSALTDPFNDPTDPFNNIDLSNFQLSEGLKTIDEDAPDIDDPADPFNNLQSDTPADSSKELKNAIEKLGKDPEVIQEIGRDLKDPTLANYGEEKIIHVNGIAGRIWYENGEWVLSLPVTENRVRKELRVNAPTAEEAVNKILEYFQKPVVQKIRELSDKERLEVARMAATNTADAINGAIGLHFAYAVPKARNASLDQIRTLASHPFYADVVNESVFFCWSHAHPGYSLTDKEFPKWLRKFLRGKAYTINSVNHAYTVYLKEKQQASNRALFEPVVEKEPTSAEIQQDLNDLDNEALKALFTRVRVHAARQ